VTSKIADEVRQAILSRLPDEPSDTKLAKSFGVSRKTIWRLRKTFRKDAINPPPLTDVPPVKIPATPVPEFPPPKELPLSELPLPRNALMPEEVSPSDPIYQKPKRSSRITLAPRARVSMGTYFAVERLRGENYKDVAYVVTEAADALKILFRKIQVLDTPAIGVTNFVRFRADIEDVFPIIKRLGRSYVVPDVEGFRVNINGGKKGRYPTAAMCSPARMGMGHTFSGTQLKRWIYQYKTHDELPPMKKAQ